MSIDDWSENIVVLELQEGPALADDLVTMMERLEHTADLNVVVSFSAINYLNSSNIAKLLRLRKKIITNRRKLVLCHIGTSVWGLFLITGLDKVFKFADNVANGLASVQLDGD